MTPETLTAALDAMALAAGDDPNRLPGLIEINDAEWCDSLHRIERTVRSLDEGIRHRGIKVLISSAFQTRALTRAEAGERGAPYQDVAPSS